MTLNKGDMVRLRGSSRTMTIVRIIGTHAHCSFTRPDKSVSNTLLRVSDLEPVSVPQAAVDAA